MDLLPEVAVTVFPARPALPVPSRNYPPALDSQRTAPPAALEPRPSPVEWARRRRAERDARRLEAAGARALTRLDRLGPAWHIVDWPRTDSLGYEHDPTDDRAGFLAIGPGGVYAVTVADHGRARVLIAGDDKAKFGVTIRALDEVRKAGIDQVSVETRVRSTGR